MGYPKGLVWIRPYGQWTKDRKRTNNKQGFGGMPFYIRYMDCNTQKYIRTGLWVQLLTQSVMTSMGSFPLGFITHAPAVYKVYK